MTSLLPLILVPAIFVTVASTLVSVGVGSWRGGAAFIVAAWLVVLAIWAQHWIVSSRPDYQGVPGEGLGLVFMGTIAIGIAVGTVAFGILATWWARKP